MKGNTIKSKQVRLHLLAADISRDIRNLAEFARRAGSEVPAEDLIALKRHLTRRVLSIPIGQAAWPTVLVSDNHCESAQGHPVGGAAT